MQNIHTLTNIALYVNARYGETIDWSIPSFHVFQIPAVDGTLGVALNGVIPQLTSYLDAYAAETLVSGRKGSHSNETERCFDRLVKALQG